MIKPEGPDRPDGPVAGSFRDPSGYVFFHDRVLYRHVGERYAGDYRQLLESGLYRRLAEEERMLVAHREVADPRPAGAGAFRVLEPQPVPFLSYPFEWSFSQLKEAALLTLGVQRLALEHGMSLKDASAYNIQFIGTRPLFIDSLSFERAVPDRPWVAYRQFCQHFLAPLLLMCQRDLRLGQLLRVHLDGVPLDLADALLPWPARLRPGVLLHVVLHARSQALYARRPPPARPSQVSRRGLLAILDSLERVVRQQRLRRRPSSAWSDYYKRELPYEPVAFADKERLVAAFLARVAPATVWDLGANLGHFSRLAARQGAYTVAMEADPAAVEECYRSSRDEVVGARLLPLWVDLTNPSPALGWQSRERQSLAGRGPADLVLALALLHHLRLGNNLPFERLAEGLAELGRWLVVEFVPKSDPQAARLLAGRADVFDDYHRAAFEVAFARRFRRVESAPLERSERVLYLMERR